MSKRAKGATKLIDAIAKPAPSGIPISAAHPPQKHPLLLVLSILLFAAWFVFLLVTALSG